MKRGSANTADHHAATGCAHPLRMLAPRIIIVIGVLSALMLLWAIVGDAYGRAYVSVAQTLFHSLGRNVQVDFSRIAEQDGRDVSMKVHNTLAGMMVERHIPSRYTGYLPTALLIALVTATPLSRRRRVQSLLVGLSALHAYMAAALLLTIARVLSRDGPAQLFELSRFWDHALALLVHHTTASPTFSALVPVIIWAAATFRRGDLTHLLPDQAANT